MREVARSPVPEERRHPCRRPRSRAETGWRFFPHDTEHTLLAPSWVTGRATANTTGGANRANFTYPNSEWIHDDLTTNTEDKLKIAGIAGKLTVSKLHYHPPGPSAAEATAGYNSGDDFEYLELLNISAETLDLRGVTISSAVTYSFASAALPSLAPGGHVLVVANAGTFAMRYGAGLPVAGTGSFHQPWLSRRANPAQT